MLKYQHCSTDDRSDREELSIESRRHASESKAEMETTREQRKRLK